MSDEDLVPGEGGELSRSPDGSEERVFPTNNGLGLYLIPRHFANSKR